MKNIPSSMLSKPSTKTAAIEQKLEQSQKQVAQPKASFRTAFKEAFQFGLKLIRPAEKTSQRASHYLKYPWPSPSPRLPDQLPPRVMNVPKQEINEFFQKVVSRYKKTLLYKWPKAVRFAFKNQYLEYVADTEFENYFNYSCFSQFLTNAFDENDFLTFKDYDIQTKEWYKADFTNTATLETLKDCYVTPSRVLFKKNQAGVFQLKAIELNGEVFDSDCQAWPLVKAFALQNAAIHIIYFQHSLLHFPLDSINAITKSVLPQNHIVSRLLMPHFYMQLPLDFAVTFVNKSVLHNDQSNAFTPFVHTTESVFDFMGIAYSGKEGKKCFPAYQFSIHPPNWPTEYGEITRAMYQIIYQFVEKVVENIPKNDATLRRWANCIAELIPGFPNEEQLFEEDILVKVLSSIILNVSWQHSADHSSYSHMKITKVPVRLRIAPPQKTDTIDLNRKAIYFEDIFRHYMFMEMYGKPTTVKKLIEVAYDFEAELQKELDEFIRNIKQLYKTTNASHYIDLEEIATSIQS